LSPAESGYSEQLPSFLYSISPTDFNIDNPTTFNSQYPDTLNWSPGGPVTLGLQAVIACNKKSGNYFPTEVVSVRSGIRNVSDSVIQLGLAYYSPDKRGIPPEYTLFIEGPYNRPRTFGYLGDDAFYGGPRKKLENIISVLPGKVFNPSPSLLYYSISDGFFLFETPGKYKLWFSYSFDSLTSSFSVPLSVVTSDTIEIQILNPKLIPVRKLLDFLPERINGLICGKPGVQSGLLNPFWNESMQYQYVYNHYYTTEGDDTSYRIAITLIDTGCMPALIDRHVLCKPTDSLTTTISGRPACVYSRHIEKRDIDKIIISILISGRILVLVEGNGKTVEYVERTAAAFDYAAMEQYIRE
jgi:hypothetical protein